MKHKEILFGLGGLVLGLFIGFVCTQVSSTLEEKTWEGSYNKRFSQMGSGHMVGMDMRMKEMTQALSGKTGDAFDKAFLSEMIVHHEGALSMARAVLQNSTRSELIQLANDIITAQTKEIATMRNWEKVWFTEVSR
ncbi:MAG: hypothetical protein RLZZ308_335 [Candidatus Parcubacteria bacterium]|jgi:uncharacterized protein (DUF305 family)